MYPLLVRRRFRIASFSLIRGWRFIRNLPVSFTDSAYGSSCNNDGVRNRMLRYKLLKSA